MVIKWRFYWETIGKTVDKKPWQMEVDPLVNQHNWENDLKGG